MDDFPGILAADFGFKPKSNLAPMAASKGPIGGVFEPNSSSFGSNRVKSSSYSIPLGGLDGYDDIYGGPPKHSNSTNGRSSTPLTSSFNFNSMHSKSVKSSTSPVFDKPVYDDDIFNGLPGLKNSSSVRLPKETPAFDDLLGNMGKMESQPKSSSSSRKKGGEMDENTSAFDDLLPGFGGSSPPKTRSNPGTNQPQQSSVPSSISTSSVVDPFVVLESASVSERLSSKLFTEPLEQMRPGQSGIKKFNATSVQGDIFDDTDPIVGIAKSKPSSSSGVINREKDGSHLGTSPHRTHNSTGKEPTWEPSIRNSENGSRKKVSFDDFRESHQSLFDMPTVSSDHRAFSQNVPHVDTSSTEASPHMGMSPKSEEYSAAADDVWLTVLEVTLTTLPTSAPPPSRPPPRPHQILKESKGTSVKSKKANGFSSQNYRSPQTIPDALKSSGVSSIDELEGFATGSSPSIVDEHGDVIINKEDAENSAAAVSAAAMKEAMDRAEAKFKQAREVREREHAARNIEAQRGRDEKIMQEKQEQNLRERHDREQEQEQRERDEKDKEQWNMVKEREEVQDIEREREKGRQAVERAMKEARERATVEARQKAERAAVSKVNAGARERAERFAVQKAHAEVRERAATEARERAEKAALEAKERKTAEDREKATADAEARVRADRTTVNRATAEARERAAAVAASAARRGNQQKNEDDFDSFFNMSARPDSSSKTTTSSFDSGTFTADDLTSVFRATPSVGDFQDIGGESDERRRARLERDQRTQERADKALAEKNERDRHTLWEQAERQRIAESLDFEIKRWSAGKVGNLRALLSTLQYVLWPECGWQPVSLTDLITSASVKKVYRKATLCIHPDKVQQKGANLQQKYIAEKVFDLLKEAWNKLNSEELF